MIFLKLLTFVHILFQNICSTLTLTGMRLTVPSEVQAGQSVTLSCLYDLEGSQLYAIKWYRYNFEFYRYVPKEAPPIRVFYLPGMSVDTSASNENDVKLMSIGRNNSGEYRCEVSADAPLFQTETISSQMLVAVIPVGKPKLDVNISDLVQNKVLLLFCIAPAAYPAANLSFFINDEMVPANTHEWTNMTEDELLEKSASLELSHIEESCDPLRLRCDAKILSLYLESSNEVRVKRAVSGQATVFVKPSSGGPDLNRSRFLCPRALLVILLLLLVTLI